MIRIDDSVITAQVLQDRLGTERSVEICPRAKLTPSALDLLRERGIEVMRRAADSAGDAAPAPAARSTVSTQRRDFKGIFCSLMGIF